MKPSPRKSEVPLNSKVTELVHGASFHDAWCITSTKIDRSALEHFLAAAEKTPRWVNAAMGARNRIVQLFGLKNLGTLDNLNKTREPKAYAPGDRVGIFTLFENSFDEVLLGDRDKHLNVVLSVHRRLLPAGQAVEVTLTTVVHVKNLLGRLYMLPVTPLTASLRLLCLQVSPNPRLRAKPQLAAPSSWQSRAGCGFPLA